MSLIETLSREASHASRALAVVDEETKNQVLRTIAQRLRDNASGIIETNTQEVAVARENGTGEAMLDRLTLNAERIEAMAEGLETVASLPDPVGKTRHLDTRPNGIEINKMRVPLGVVCMIYEARPNVTADAGALCLKSGNAVILRGGKEALTTSLKIASIMQAVLEEFNLPPQIITVVPDPDRGLMMELMQQDKYIDVIIPRGGEGLINFVTDNSRVPVIQHFQGVCHLYVDKQADFQKAIDLLVNGKTQRTGVCNALECLVVHADIAEQFLALASKELRERKVVINGCEKTANYITCDHVISDSDFGKEYLCLEIAIRVVDSLNSALDHIAEFGSNHTEVIATEDERTGAIFQQTVDASVVMVNASSRFSDGSELGLGAEIGIATTKLHAYGPMGLESLTTEKFLVNGTGQVRT
ncbi:glutamate-5-semialdehyde dehydrogenase [Alteromonas sp. 5E99-2]|uniref:glutamate-5-semialdehyde dehydrogenase n=1 Tax=Alteromonas sp. 5E99-2 TaxID=2817683 RepID=UPI001A98A4E1|nr:glutamate-5-semialdehyde dehydrogenase [Alteromonas sp. 5E99-2]MBO1254744.1 glutamate-5-semialdehyde dehydrogenase [Alteromonas sp. 5E99-2]